METVRTIAALAAQRQWKIHQLDVKSAFLHGELEEDVYMEQPRWFQEKESEKKILKLHKALYGLKQTPRAWFSMIEKYFVQEGLEKCQSEQTLFTKWSNAGNLLIVSVYVYDLIYTSDNAVMLEDFKMSMMNTFFEMTELWLMRYFLGIEVTQKKYAKEILEKFGMDNCQVVKTPMVPETKLHKDDAGTTICETTFKQMVGSSMYLTSTWSDLVYVVSIISHFMSKPTYLHLQVAKRIMRYIKGTPDYGAMYNRVTTGLIGYTNSDYA